MKMKIPKTDLHIPDILYTCPECNSSFWRLGNLTKHVKSKHPEHYIGN